MQRAGVADLEMLARLFVRLASAVKGDDGRMVVFAASWRWRWWRRRDLEEFLCVIQRRHAVVMREQDLR